ncbi:MAG: prepilin-type N-terminal cleavage/methylation domain-containing protein [Candidatus Falkowbacteria bacterium]|nr:MAG: prepilin-type N-terminal cleavage/methylation domain-containing protein [Candidatus Falkowbacteria bacterium]
MQQNKKGFTLIELLVVIAIIGLLSTMSVLALNQARARARDAKRISDVKQIQTALELYYNEEGSYPASVTTGGTIQSTAGNVYLAAVPTPPSPIDGGSCPATQPAYTYAKQTTSGTGGSYTINYCLGATINTVPGNALQTATPAGIKL